MKGKSLLRFQKWTARGSLFAGLCWIIFFSFSFMEESIPDKIWIEKGKEENFNFRLPVTGELEQEGLEVFGNQSPAVEQDKIKLDLNESFSLKSTEQGKYSITCRLFGLFLIKEVAVEVVEEAKVVPCGIPVGIYVKTDGILIIGTGTVTGSDGMSYEPAENLVKSGDYVKTVDDQVIGTKEELIEKINQCQGEPVILGVLREDEYIHLKVQPVQEIGRASCRERV